jgi:coenzyme Q-binding protein COQ10
MPKFDTTRWVEFAPEQMFALVADIEKYPEFLPMCQALHIRARRVHNDESVLIADMTVGYKAITETFTSQVHLKPQVLEIDVRYVDGPFRYLTNEWRFEPERGGTLIRFHIDYEFRSRMLGALAGAMFDRAFRMFTESFEQRARQVYGDGAAA